MTKKMSDAGDPAFYPIAEAAWTLGVDHAQLHRAIRVGALPVVRRRSRLVISADALRRVLEGGAR